MCGIAGFITTQPALAQDLRAQVARMTQTLLHRGPDGHGVWTDPECGVALGHRRLAVVELSEAGAQPMISACGRFVMTFNGEIYNAEELRASLDAQKQTAWRGHADTEVLLEAFAHWGIERSLRLATGMFALAAWDRRERRLWLARDRLGEKPLYYGWVGPNFMFASELKALRAHPGWRGVLAHDSLLEYARFSYIAAPRSIYSGITKLLPGCYAVISPERGPGVAPDSTPYWTVREPSAESSNPVPRDLEGAIAGLEERLSAAVRRQLVADVPVGALLSGGIDSATVVALVQRHSKRPARTFTIGFHETNYDETPHAALVAQRLGTDHTEAYVSSKDALELIPALPQVYDEPHADPSQIPTYFVSRLARQAVTVALSGDGGDELFCGYEHYFLTDSIWRAVKHFPPATRAMLGSTLRGASSVAQALPPRRLFDRLFKLGESVDADSEAQLFERVVDGWRNGNPVAGASRLPWWRAEALDLMPRDPWLGMSTQDLLTYMPNAILVKVDRAAMAVSLETRVPFLDHTVVEYAMALPTELKVRDGRGKFVLRQLLQRYLPLELFDRPKQGFSVPIAQWLRGPLRDWAEDLLSESNLRADGYFDTALIRRRWAEHAGGGRDWHACLWNVLMFQAWLRSQRE
jgi:asparagine synthase (glutamine-hydrolysing)